MKKENSKETLANEEIDIYDIVDNSIVEARKGFKIYREGEYEDPEISYPTLEETRREMELDRLRAEAEQEAEYEKYKREFEPRFLVVKIRISNGRVYEVAKVPVADLDFIDEQEEELFFHYYKKLNKRHFHIQKPRHRVFRTSIIDELFIELTDI